MLLLRILLVTFLIFYLYSVLFGPLLYILWAKRAGLRVEIKPLYKWYDLWIGMYYDKKNAKIYICVIPTTGFTLSFHKKEGP